MGTPFDPRRTFHELALGLDVVLPYARAGAVSAPGAASFLAEVQFAMHAARRLDALPWAAVLEVSVTHLSASERDLLVTGAPPDPFTLCMANEYAWMLRLPDELPDSPSLAGPGLADLFGFARSHGFRYLRLDLDALPLSGMDVRS